MISRRARYTVTLALIVVGIYLPVVGVYRVLEWLGVLN